MTQMVKNVQLPHPCSAPHPTVNSNGRRSPFALACSIVRSILAIAMRCSSKQQGSNRQVATLFTAHTKQPGHQHSQLHDFRRASADLLQDIHWLPVDKRVNYKVTVMWYIKLPSCVTKHTNGASLTIYQCKWGFPNYLEPIHCYNDVITLIK